jgi:PAS domain S-box-containing protein
MTESRAFTAAGLLIAGVLALDVAIPTGNGIGALYAIPLLILSYAGRFDLAMYAGWLVSLLIVGRIVALPAAITTSTLINRAVALTVVWSTVAIVVRLRGTTSRLAGQTRDLADLKFAIDQSAIVATTDVRGRITYVNDKFCEISGYRREELLGQDHRLINSGYHPKEFIRTLWTTIGSGRVWRGELRNRAKDGTIYWVDTTIVPFLKEDGRPYQYMAIRYEITDRKRSEEQLRDQAALARLGEMAAVVAHEVKNPIAGIRGALQVIMGRSPLEPRDRGILSDIIARLDALNGIVQDLLLYARPRQPRLERVDFHGLFENTAQLLRRDPSHANVTVRVTGDAPAVTGDADQLRLVFQNLMLNAAQAMKGDGVIDIEVAADGDGWRIRVRDHGPGMTAEVRDKAFEAFFTTKHRGTGLGLPIARRVIEAHGGRIALDAPDGGGAAVTIWLPATRSAPA